MHSSGWLACGSRLWQSCEARLPGLLHWARACIWMTKQASPASMLMSAAYPVVCVQLQAVTTFGLSICCFLEFLQVLAAIATLLNEFVKLLVLSAMMASMASCKLTSWSMEVPWPTYYSHPGLRCHTEGSENELVYLRYRKPDRWHRLVVEELQ